MTRRWLAAGVLLVALVVAGMLGYRALDRSDTDGRSIVAQDLTPGEAAPAETIETVASSDIALPTGGTPMAERVAVVGLLNKRNGVSRDVTLKPGQAVRIGDAIVRLRACEHTAPWEQDQLTGAFVQLDVRGIDTHWRRVFSGWLYKERPALNVVLHPVYDVWTKGCTVAFPEPKPAATTPSRRVAPTNAPAAPDDGAPADEAVGETAPAPTAPPTAAPAVQPPAN